MGFSTLFTLPVGATLACKSKLSPILRIASAFSIALLTHKLIPLGRGATAGGKILPCGTPATTGQVLCFGSANFRTECLLLLLLFVFSFLNLNDVDRERWSCWWRRVWVKLLHFRQLHRGEM